MSKIDELRKICEEDATRKWASYVFLQAARSAMPKLLAVAEAAHKVIGLACKNARYGHEGCNACALAAALSALETPIPPAEEVIE